MRIIATCLTLAVLTVAAGALLLTASQAGGLEPAGPACADDAFEENDSLGAASMISLPFSEAGLRSCPGDEDWFSFQVTAGSQIQIDATFIDQDGDIDIELYDPNGLEVADSGGIFDNEKISCTALATGMYAVQVDLFGIPAEGNFYDLAIALDVEVADETCGTEPTPEPTETPTPTPTSTSTPTPTPTATLTPTAEPTATAAPTPAGVVGDADCTGEVNAIDVAFILQLIAGLLETVPCQVLADANVSGGVDAVDAALILQFIAGLIDSLPPA